MELPLNPPGTQNGKDTRPLAEKLRPQSLADVVGQPQLTGPDGLLQRLIAAGTPQSVIFWGPPGVGKTTLARLYANAFGAEFVQISAVLAGVADVRRIVDDARQLQALRRTVLFVDEIHRFTKAQQDAFLPHVEAGLLILVGATTENPSFALNNALLSRCQVLVLNPLDEIALQQVLDNAEAQTGLKLPLNGLARKTLLDLAHGDARYLLNLVETLYATLPEDSALLNPVDLQNYLPGKMALYDRDGDQHYDLISALHKSIRGSDPDAALYWLARMLQGGEDGLFLARRLIRMAAEDIGLADPQALPLAIAARESFHMLGTPEGELMLAEVAVYLALAPKSNAVYTAWKAAQALAAETPEMAPPKHIVNAPTKMMKQLGHGAGYAYDHDAPGAFSGQNYFPAGILKRPKFYDPVERGFEREMTKRLTYFHNLRLRRQGSGK